MMKGSKVGERRPRANRTLRTPRAQQLDVILSRLDPLARKSEDSIRKKQVMERHHRVDHVHSSTERSLARMVGEIRRLDAQAAPIKSQHKGHHHHHQQQQQQQRWQRQRQRQPHQRAHHQSEVRPRPQCAKKNTSHRVNSAGSELRHTRHSVDSEKHKEGQPTRSSGPDTGQVVARRRSIGGTQESDTFSKIANKWLQAQLGGVADAGHWADHDASEPAQLPSPSSLFLIDTEVAEGPGTLDGLAFFHLLRKPSDDGVGVAPSIYIQAIMQGDGPALLLKYWYRFDDQKSQKHLDYLSRTLDLRVFVDCLPSPDDFVVWHIRDPEPDFNANHDRGHIPSKSTAESEPEAMLQFVSPFLDQRENRSERHHLVSNIDTLPSDIRRRVSLFTESASMSTPSMRRSHQVPGGTLAAHGLLQPIPRFAPFPAEELGMPEGASDLVKEWTLRVVWSSPGIIHAAVLSMTAPRLHGHTTDTALVKPVDIGLEWIGQPARYVSRAMEHLQVTFRKRAPRRMAFDFVLTRTKTWFLLGAGPVQFDVSTTDKAWACLDIQEFALPSPAKRDIRRENVDPFNRRRSWSASTAGPFPGTPADTGSKFSRMRALPVHTQVVSIDADGDHEDPILFKASTKVVPPKSRSLKPSQVSKGIGDTSPDSATQDICLLCAATLSRCQCWD